MYIEQIKNSYVFKLMIAGTPKFSFVRDITEVQVLIQRNVRDCLFIAKSKANKSLMLHPINALAAHAPRYNFKKTKYFLQYEATGRPVFVKNWVK